jgi:hypothetical protein
MCAIFDLPVLSTVTKQEQYTETKDDSIVPHLLYKFTQRSKEGSYMKAWKFIAIMSPKWRNFSAFAKYRGSFNFRIFIELRNC